MERDETPRTLLSRRTVRNPLFLGGLLGKGVKATSKETVAVCVSASRDVFLSEDSPDAFEGLVGAEPGPVRNRTPTPPEVRTLGLHTSVPTPDRVRCATPLRVCRVGPTTETRSMKGSEREGPRSGSSPRLPVSVAVPTTLPMCSTRCVTGSDTPRMPLTVERATSSSIRTSGT